MTTNTDVLTQSLIDYIIDVKPFHTKFRNVTSQLSFTDGFNINVREEFALEAHLQNMWSRDDIGGYTLFNMSEHAEADRTYILPAVVFPHFSINDSLNQSPLGNDPTDNVLTDVNLDGLPDVYSSGATIEIPASNTFDMGQNNPFGSVDHQTPTPGNAIAYGTGIITGTIPAATVPVVQRGPNKSHQSWDDMIPVEASVYNLSQTITGQALVVDLWVVTSTLIFTIDNSGEALYSFDESTIQISINGQTWLGLYNKVGNTIQIDGYTQSFASEIDYLATLGQFQDLVPTISINVLYLFTGRYAVPFHQGSRVWVNSIQQSFGIDYVVDSSRSFIQFLPTKWPVTNSLIDINLFKSDRLFICKNDPFVPVNDYFLLTITGDGQYSLSFNNSQVGTNKATLQNVAVTGAVGSVWKITATGAWNFSVQQISPTSATIENAYFKVPFQNLSISFTIDRNWNNFYSTMSGDFYSYFIIQDTNSYGTLGTDITYDQSEFLPNLNVISNSEVTFDPLGIVKKNAQGNYVFEFTEIPAVYTYIEFKVEQEGQFNPWVNTSITEQINFFDLIYFDENCDSNSEPLWGQYALAQYNETSDPLVIDQEYNIVSIGTTDFTLIGAVSNTTGITFTSTVNGVIVGTGTASEVLPVFAVTSPLYPQQPRVTWYESNTFYDILSYDAGTYDFSDFVPHTELNLLTGGVNTPNHSRLDSEGFYPFIRDDMYLTVVFQDTLETRIRHNVVLADNANLYQESQLVNDLILFRVGDTITSVTVYLDGLAILPTDASTPYTVTIDEPSSPGHIKPVLADGTVHSEVIISFDSGVLPQSFAVKLN